MYRCMDRVHFDGCNDVEASLLESKAHSARAGEKIYGDRSMSFLHCSLST